MKKITFKNLCLLTLAFLGMQAVNAQYLGYPFGGTATVISATPGNSTRIECENFDSTDVAGTNDGANYSDNATTPPGNVVGSYNDKSATNLGTSINTLYRPDGDVDVTEIDNGDGTFKFVVSGNQGQEYQMHTITVAQAGNYTVSLNYAHGGSGKTYQIFLRNISDLSSVHTFMNEEIPNTGSSFIFADHTDATRGTADLVAGTYVLQARTVSAGPNYDYITFTTNSVLSNEEFDTSSIFISNPVQNELSIEGLTSNVKEVNVYSLLGNLILKSNVNSESSLKLDISSLSRGMYIVKLQGENGSFSKKIVKQ